MAKKEKKYDESFYTALANIKAMAEMGICLIAGTDAMYPGVFYGEGIHRELELLVEAGLSPLQAISTATVNAAKLLGEEKIWGKIAKNMRADVLIVDGRPDIHIQETRSIQTIIQQGKIINRKSLHFQDHNFLLEPIYF